MNEEEISTEKYKSYLEGRRKVFKELAEIIEKISEGASTRTLSVLNRVLEELGKLK